MTNFKPFVIKHVQILEINSFELVPENQYLVFWWKDIPLGNLWLYADDRLDSSFFRLKVNEAIHSSITYYLSGNNNVNNSEWSKYIIDGNEEKLENELNNIVPFSGGSTCKSDNLSVVICTRNRPQAITECVKSLLESTDLDFELIVVDNASDDDATEQAIRRFSDVRYIKEPCKGLDIARNTGARYASHSIIAYTDDDVIVDRNWIKNLKIAFRDPKTMAVTGLVIPMNLQTESQYIFERDWGFNKGYCPRTFDSKYFNEYVDIGVPTWDIGAGANMAFKREVFDLVGWFDERLDVGASGCSGDSEFWYRILAEGWNCTYYPQLFVYHKHRESKKELKSQIFNYMRGQTSSLLVQHENYRHKGNLFRAYKSLPRYYLKRIFSNIVHLKYADLLDNLNQIHGCISGWRYYNRHRSMVRRGNLLYSNRLDNELVIDLQTKVSVIIPCYNHGEYLREAIDSVLNQTYKNIEIVVVNDGSSDDTEHICNDYVDIKYVYTNRLGLSGARNMGVKYSTGDFLVFLDSDDRLYPKAIETNLWFFSNNRKTAFVSGAHDKVDNYGNMLPVEPHLPKAEKNFISLLQGNYIAMEGTVMYRRELFCSFFFDPQLRACEDYDINLKIARHFPSITHGEKIAVYRIHEHNMSADRKLMLRNVVDVLHRQKRVLKNAEEEEAFEKGLENWQNYYSS